MKLTRYAVAPLILLCLLIALAGCTGARMLYSKPTTGPGYAKAVLIHHNALGKEVAQLRNDPQVSAESQLKLLAFYRPSVCSKDELARNVSTANCIEGPSYRTDAAIKAVESLRNAQTEAELQAAVNELVPLIARLVDVIQGVK